LKKIVLCVDGVFVKKRKILLLKRNVKPYKGFWHLIGGHVKANESLKEALKREFKEETNLDIEVGEIIDARIEETLDRTKVIVALQVTSAHGEIKLNFENIEYGWFSKTPQNSSYNYSKYLSNSL
jgi:ADP-ribose pyrophosphatase YjhB (NUDIX family)